MPIANVQAVQARIDQGMRDRNGAYNTVTLQGFTVTQPANPDLEAATRTPFQLTLSIPPIVEEVNVREVENSGGVYMNGDKRYTISATALTPSQLATVEDVLDGTDTLRIVERNHDMVMGGQVLTWQIVAGERRAS